MSEKSKGVSAPLWIRTVLQFPPLATAIAGAVIVLLVILIASSAPPSRSRTPTSMAELDLADAYKRLLDGGQRHEVPSGHGPAGARLVSAIVYGSRVSLIIGLWAAAGERIASLSAGLGFFGAGSTRHFMRVADGTLVSHHAHRPVHDVCAGTRVRQLISLTWWAGCATPTVARNAVGQKERVHRATG